MLILKFNTLSADDLFAVERCLLRWLDDKARPSISPTFNLLDYGRTEIYGHLLGIFAKLHVLDALKISPSDMLDFLIDVDATYLDAPYHSFYHAVDIVTVLYFILTDLEADQYLCALDITVLLIAALCHDAGHPGYNNIYQVNFKTDLAVRYNDTSVLEAHSVTITRSLLHKHKLLKNLGTGQWSENEVMDAIEHLILSTDMVYHYELQEQVGLLEELLTQDDDDNDNDDHDYYDDDSLFTSDSDSMALSASSICDDEDVLLLNRDQRRSLCGILLHAADISNTVRPWPISKQWSDLIVQEFFRQGDAERMAGLDVSPGMDRDRSTQPDISLKFGDYLVKPYFEALAGFLPSARVFLDTLSENRSEWERLKECPKSQYPSPVTLAHERQFPSSLLPAQPLQNPSGRRISVAAGTVIIPDREIVVRRRQGSTLVLSGRHHRRLLGHRSASHSGLSRIGLAVNDRRRQSEQIFATSGGDQWLSPSLLKTTSMLESPLSLYHPQDPFPSSRLAKRVA